MYVTADKVNDTAQSILWNNEHSRLVKVAYTPSEQTPNANFEFVFVFVSLFFFLIARNTSIQSDWIVAHSN